EVLEQARRARARRQARDLAVGIVEVAERDRARGTGLRACRQSLHLSVGDRPVGELRGLAHLADAVVAEGALLDHAFGPRRDVGVEEVAEALRPLRLLPVEVP